MRTKINQIAAAAVFLAGCGSRGGKVQELVSSLRSFGISAEPLVPPPSSDAATPSTVLLTFYAAVPLGQTATLTPFVDSGSGGGALPIPASALSVQAGSDKYTDYNKFRLFSQQVKITLPTYAQFHATAATFKGAQVKYGLTVATATEHEDVIANLALFGEGAPEAAWKNPIVNITAPAASATINLPAKNVDLSATIDNVNGEPLKVGWFATDGTISNRRASATKWSFSDTGPETLAIAVHGAKSRGFALQVIDVEGQ